LEVADYTCTIEASTHSAAAKVTQVTCVTSDFAEEENFTLLEELPSLEDVESMASRQLAANNDPKQNQENYYGRLLR
jgi:hypothetical protein